MRFSLYNVILAYGGKVSGKRKRHIRLRKILFKDIPKDVSAVLQVEGVRPIKSGGKFKAFGERGLFTFLYVQGDSITCFDSMGQFRALPLSKVKKSVNRSHRERHADKGKGA